jgi:hypothetical protein
MPGYTASHPDDRNDLTPKDPQLYIFPMLQHLEPARLLSDRRVDFSAGYLNDAVSDVKFARRPVRREE